LYSVLALDSEGVGAEFEVESELVGVTGIPLVVPMGALDGKAGLSLRITMKEVMPDGGDFDNWIQKENEAGFLRKRRLEILKKEREVGPKITTLANGVQRASFEVPPTFLTFLRGEESDSTDLVEILKKQGFDFGKRDRVVFSRGREEGLFFVQSTRENVELLKGIVGGLTPPPALLSCHLFLVESEGRLDEARLKEGTFQILGRISSSQLPGRVAKVGLGSGFELESVFQLDGQLDGAEELMEGEVSIRWKEGEEFSGKVETRPGVPLVIAQTREGEVWRSWVLTTSAVWMQDLAAEALGDGS